MKWFLGVLLVLLVALLLESGLVAYAMYVLLGLLLLSRLLALSWVGNVEVTRACDETELEVGDTLAVRVTVRNLSPVPIPWLLVEDVLPAKGRVADHKKLRLTGKRIKMAMVAPRGRTELNYKIRFRARGYYQVGPLVLETGDFFGLHRRYHVGTEPHFALVYPRVVPLEGYELASRRPIGEIRLAHRLYEDPTRIAGVRQYEAGDPLSRVHWRATARTGTLHCKVYEPSTIAGATVLLDLHESGYPPQGEPSRSELAVTAAASLAFALYQMGQQTGLVTNARDAADRVREEGWEHDFRTRAAAWKSVEQPDLDTRLQPVVVETRRGVEQFQRIWATLARCELNDGLTLAQTVREASARLPRDATVIAVLPQVTTDTALALGHLRRRGFAVTAVLIALKEGTAAPGHARLVAEGIEVRHVRDEATLAAACQRQVLR